MPDHLLQCLVIQRQSPGFISDDQLVPQKDPGIQVLLPLPESITPVIQIIHQAQVFPVQDLPVIHPEDCEIRIDNPVADL